MLRKKINAFKKKSSLPAKIGLFWVLFVHGVFLSISFLLFFYGIISKEKKPLEKVTPKIYNNCKCNCIGEENGRG